MSRRLVVDAGVVLKWFFRDREPEVATAVAVDILLGMRRGHFSLHQPPHFI